MNRILFCTVVMFAMLFCGCNSAFRPNKTQIHISQDVAKYLAKTEMVIHNNSTRKQIERIVKLETVENDTPIAQLTYKKVQGKMVILQIKDSLGHMRNVAIPQVKLTAYPLLVSTTLSPSITYFLLSAKRNQEENAVLVFVYHALVSTIDAYVGAASMVAKRHARYEVPQSFSLSKLSDVTTIDPSNQAQLLDVPMPINQNPTPYLSEKYQKKYQYIFSVNSGYGITQSLSTKFLNSHNSQIALPNNMVNGQWTSFGFHIQPSKKYQWGFSYHTKGDPNLSCNFLLNEIGYLIPYKKGHFEIGGGLGWGMTNRIHGDNYVDSFTSFQGQPLASGRLLEEGYKFVPNVNHAFMPVNGHIQFIYPIKNNFEITATASYLRVPCYSNFITAETLLTQENITPNITSFKREELSSKEITIKTVNQVYTLSLSIRMKI